MNYYDRQAKYRSALRKAARPGEPPNLAAYRNSLFVCEIYEAGRLAALSLYDIEMSRRSIRRDIGWITTDEHDEIRRDLGMVS